MEQSTHGVRLINAAIVFALCAAATFGNQDPSELDSAARERIEQARASIVLVKMVDQANETISQTRGFFIRKDLVATDIEVDRNSRLEVIAATKVGTVKVLSSGNYFLPYVVVQTQAEVLPLTLGDSERVVLNDAVYMFSEAGPIVSGRVIGSTTIRNTRAFLISIPIDSNNKGLPIFNRYSEVIGLAATSPDGQSAGLMWPSHLLATLKHLGEPGVGVGAGDGPRMDVGAGASNADGSAATRVDTKPIRLSAPNPRYTEAARANGIQGSVVLRVLVGEDGNVNAIRVVRGLPDGVTEQAIAAARLSKFKPAMKDGKPVPYWVVLEINFNIR
jgi:TonB family protein